MGPNSRQVVKQPVEECVPGPESFITETASEDIYKFLINSSNGSRVDFLFDMDASVGDTPDPKSTITLNSLDVRSFEAALISPLPSPTPIEPTAEVWKEGDASNAPSRSLGLFRLAEKEFIYSMLMRQYADDQKLWRQWLNRIERTLRGLERVYGCDIMMYDVPFYHRGCLVHMIRIRGASKEAVLACKNAMPESIQKLLITSKAHY